MIGTNDGQLTFTHVGAWCGDLLDPHSFYAKMNLYGATWFRDEDYAIMYSAGGRPSVPPSLLARALLLQMFAPVSDEELVARIRFDLRYKYALDLPLEYEGFHPSLLSHFRARLLKHKLQDLAFKRSLEMAKMLGFVAGGEAQATDSAPIHGAAAVQDTWTLLRTGIEKLLLALAPFEVEGFTSPLGKGKYLPNSGKADIDWNNVEAKNQYLAELVGDARTLLGAVKVRILAGTKETTVAQSHVDAAKHYSELLRLILAQDIEDAPTGPRIRKGKNATKNRIISTNDPEMRHGHKSKSNLFHGYKSAITVTLETELVTSVDVIAANAPDSTPLLGQLDFLKLMDIFPAKVYADCAYGGAEMRFQVMEKGSEVRAKVPAGSSTSKYFAKERFTIQMKGQVAEQVTCPDNKTTSTFRESKDDQGNPIQIAQFSQEQCGPCPVREKCTPLKTKGREIPLHHRESILQAARGTAAAPGFRQDMKKRLVVERLNSRLQDYGLKAGRYFGKSKTLLQALLAAAVNNFWRVTTMQMASANTE